LPRTFCSELALLIVNQVGLDEVVEEVLAASVPGHDGEADTGGAASSGSAPVIAASSAVQVLVAPLPIDSDLLNWAVTPLGYVRHNRATRDAGRVTMFKSNIAVTCYQHSKCNVVRSANKYSREHMLQWLVLGVPLGPTVTSDERRAAGVAHMQLFRNI
jgi:hypothetical protein